MNKLEEFKQKLLALWEKVKPYVEKAGKVLRKAKALWKKAWPWIWQARKILLAVPVVYLMLYFARLNWNVLPDPVGIHLLTNGEYAMSISKEMAVYVPLGVTGGCLTMMVLSRKTLYPWVICLFSMLLPLLILITNIFPS